MNNEVVIPRDGRVRQLLSIDNDQTRVTWQFSANLGWYVQVLGKYYQIIYDEYLNVTDLDLIC
ncbi:hypothetical protein ESZ50_00160 [Weissella muntiaci]|uniref:Uncharacterized protein n=1 Tax=Weissella muntiaci TaxID=2508881 RepID=A0A6C2CC58_9LACO|nr:hypothetical protein [Weissella muntiaci]TYC50983.1 hypothetical protein ESZ50_00160 [Weissella muntiaci]